MSDFTELLSTRGPFASVALNSPSALDDAGDQLAVRWGNARRELDEAGFPEEELERMDAAIESLDHGEGASLVVLHAAGGRPYVEFLDDSLQRDLAVVGELPRLGPVLESRQQAVPHLIVTTDRTGADIVAVDAGSDEELVEVSGDEQHIQRSGPGGWSQRRFQQRAENQWESNAQEVADVVAETAQRVEARLVTVAGDVRAVGFLLEHLPPELGDVTRTLDGQSEELIAEETVTAVADVAARETREVMERFDEQHGQGRAAGDVATTLDALTTGRVEILLVHDDPEDDRTARFDPTGMWCSADLDLDPEQIPVEEVAEGRLIDVAIRSALMGDAAVRFVPAHGGPSERLGAILRW